MAKSTTTLFFGATLFLWILKLETATSFSPTGRTFARRPALAPFAAATTDTDVASPTSTGEYAADDDESQLTSKGLYKRDRYVATNRFAVRRGQQAKFEKRWATRKSRLATLPGFKYFHLMRRVTLNSDGTTTYDEGDSDETAMENYVSFTIWNKKSDFSAWRNGEAFKEAHGGTSIGAFLSTMVNSALVLRGAPRPAFYDGLFVQSTHPASVPETVDGWRNVEADGVNTLPAECFVTFQKYFVASDKAQSFEKLLAAASPTTSTDACVASSLLRRDGQAKGHGVTPMEPTEPNYVRVAVWKDRDAYKAASLADPEGLSSLYKRSPETTFYEGTLVISSEEGA